MNAAKQKKNFFFEKTSIFEVKKYMTSKLFAFQNNIDKNESKKTMKLKKFQKKLQNNIDKNESKKTMKLKKLSYSS